MSTVIRTIVAGVADPAQEDALLAAALGWARELRATLHLVHCYGASGDAHRTEALGGRAGVMELWRQDGLRTALEMRVRALGGDIPVVCHAVPGPANRAIVQVAHVADADLVLVGATRRGRVGRWLLGTTAQHVVRFARTPVLVVREGRARPPKRVLLTADLTEFSAAVHEETSRLVSALCGPERPAMRSLFVSPQEGEQAAGKSRGELLEWGASELESFLWEGSLRQLPIESRVRLGHPAHEIVAEAGEWDADLLVLGTRARKGAVRVLWGSVAEEALPNAPCDVLVVPMGAINARERVAN